MIDRAEFFADIRKTVFGGTLAQPQVDGVNAILDEWEKRDIPKFSYLAYLLATPCIETGMRFQPITESLNYSVSALRSKFPSRITQAEANRYGRKAGQTANQQAIGNIIYGGHWGARNLGNAGAGDGYRFRGRGLCQLTGRLNYLRASKATGVDLVADPDRAAELRLSVAVMFDAMLNGWFTGKKLSDYLGGGIPDFVNARRTINGTDRARDIADYAQLFLLALEATYKPGRPAPAPVPSPTPIPAPVPRPQPDEAGPEPREDAEPKGLLGLILRVLRAIFGRR